MTMSFVVFAYLSLGVALVLAGAFELALAKAIPSSLSMRTLAVSGAFEASIALKLLLLRLIVYSACVAFWPYLILVERSEKRAARANELELECASAMVRQFDSNANNLLRRYTIEQVESEHTKEDPSGRVPNIPFGFINERWCELKSVMQPGDELWSFHSDRGGGPLAGCEGFAVVRAGEIVEEIVHTEY